MSPWYEIIFTAENAVLLVLAVPAAIIIVIYEWRQRRKTGL